MEPKSSEEVEKVLKLYLEWILFSENNAYIQVSMP
jgi:hypothetical protein